MYITSFFACLYAKVIAVPASPPNRNKKWLRLEGIINDSNPKVILTKSTVLSLLNKRVEDKSKLKEIEWINIDLIENQQIEYWENHGVKPDDIAFLQYTSGSTSNPKGIIITHENVISNEKMIEVSFKHDENLELIIMLWKKITQYFLKMVST
jgi:acyl-CoA synthetase (AMP-forming)/AMP-acid ligase II